MRFLPLVIITLILNTFSMSAEAAPLKVVTSFSILRNMIEVIGGADASVVGFVGPDADAHAYQPTPADLKAIKNADLIVINGLHFDDWMLTMVTTSKTQASVVIASQNVKPLPSDEHESDPHAWQDLRNGIIYATTILEAMTKAAPDKAPAFKKRAQKFSAAIEKKDAQIRAELAAIPVEKRKIITSHDAFGYFGASYGVKFLAPLGVNPEAEPSASDVVKLIKQIKDEHISVLFIENMSNPKLLQQIARETGAKLGGELYADALSEPTGPAPTYLSLFDNNLRKMKDAMRSN